jgi:hypothetical protein
MEKKEVLSVLFFVHSPYDCKQVNETKMKTIAGFLTV